MADSVVMGQRITRYPSMRGMRGTAREGHFGVRGKASVLGRRKCVVVRTFVVRTVGRFFNTLDVFDAFAALAAKFHTHTHK